jgi:hypothetical protein
MPTWQEQETNSRKPIPVTAEKAADLDKAKEEGLPTVIKQAAKGELPVQPVQLQPVRSPGIYEGEFGVKDDDLIFHFWPYGYHDADRKGLATPRFKKDFESTLKAVAARELRNRAVVEHDQDVGAYFVRGTGWGTSQFHHDIAVKFCQALHTALGGTEG